MSTLPVAVSIVVVVESGGRYLMIGEVRDHDAGAVWYFPSGALEAGESLAGAARREVREETGYDVDPTGVVAIDHGAFAEPARLLWWRFAISARLTSGDRRPVNEPAIQAVEWFDVDHLAGLVLRAGDAPWLCERAQADPGLSLEACRLAVDGRLQGFFA